MSTTNAEDLGLKIATLLKLKRQLVDRDMSALDLSRTQWRVLFYLKHFSPCTQKALNEKVDIDCAHLTRILDQLEIRKWISRTISTEDKRIRMVELTPLCKKKILPAIDASIAKENQVLVKGLSALEKKMLSQLLEKLHQNLLNELSE